MSRVVIVTCVFPPETNTGGENCCHLAQYMAEGGHTVSVVCPMPSRPKGVRYSTLEDRSRLVVRMEGKVEVVRLPTYASPESRLFPRFRESFGFGKAAGRYIAEHLRDSQAIYSMSWPLAGNYNVARMANRLNIPVIINIQDIYPESLASKLPRWVTFLVFPILTAWDRAIVQRAHGMVAISDNMREVYQKTRGIPRDRIVVVPTWHDEKLFLPPADRMQAEKRYHIAHERFTFMYLGNIGRVADVEGVVGAFLVANLPDAQLLIVGEGSCKEKCKSMVKLSGATNVFFLSDPDVANVPLLQSLADVCLLPVKRGAAFSSIPSKFVSYLFSGKPVLASVDGGSDTERAILSANCGWAVEPENSALLTEQMKRICRLSARELAAMGQNGLTYGLKHFSRSQFVPVLARSIESFAGISRPQ